MNQNASDETIRPVGASLDRNVEVLATKMRIRDLSIDREEVLAYMQSIPPEKREIALIHAIEVGVTEIMARRKRIRH